VNSEAGRNTMTMTPGHKPASEPERRSTFALAAIALGFVALAPLFLILVTVDDGAAGNSGSGRIYADGSVVIASQQPAYSFADFASAAFLMCLVSLLLSLASFYRRERLVLSLCALSYGLAPAFMYVWLGFMLGALPPLVFTAALLAFALAGKLRGQA